MYPLYRQSALYSGSDTERIGAPGAKPNDHRDAFEVDRSRVIHSFAFRRLQSKTQIFGLNESSFLRTRLTHSLEVGSIARSITAVLNAHIWKDYPSGAVEPAYAPLAGPIDTSLIEAASLAHDLGHPPFGHRGEEALNYMLWNAWSDHSNGFEGNGQTLRVLTNENLEVHAERHGLNLCRATLLAVVKYPRPYENLVNPALLQTDKPCPPFKPWAPPKCIHNEERTILEWLIAPFSESDREEFLRIEPRPGKHARTLYKTLEASIIELADDIAYGTHDVEDAFFAGLIQPESIIGYMNETAFHDPAVYRHYHRLITAMGRGSGTAARKDQVFEKKGAASALIGSLIGAATLRELPQFEHPRLRWNATLPHDHRLALDALRESVYELVINGSAVQSLEFRGGVIILKLFEALANTPELVGGKPGHIMKEAPGENARLRALTDYISGMTDNYAERLYNRLFSPGAGSIFDRL